MSVVDDIINSTLSSVGGINTPSLPQSQATMTNEQAEALGYQYAAAMQGLTPEEFETYGPKLPENLTAVDIANIGRGISTYDADRRVGTQQGASDYIASGLAGAAEGALGTAYQTGATWLGEFFDAGASAINQGRKLAGLPVFPHDFAGRWGAAAQQQVEDLANFIDYEGSDQVHRAMAAEKAARTAMSEQKRQEDIANGASEFTAGLRQLGRDTLEGATHFFDDPLAATRQTTSLAGQIAVQAATRGALLRAKAAQLTPRAVDALILGATEGAGNVGSATEEIYKLPQEALIQNSAKYRNAYLYYIDAGYSPEEADIAARQSLSFEASQKELGSGILGGALGGYLMKPLDNLSGLIGGSAREAGEEAITGLVQGIGSNYAKQSTYDENQTLTEDVGTQVAEGAITGGLGSATLRTPGSIVQGVSDVNQQIQQSREERKANAQETLKRVKQAKTQAIDAAPSSVVNTVDTPSELDDEETNSVDYEEITTEDGTKKIRFLDSAIEDPTSISPEMQEKYGLSKDADAFDLLDAQQNKFITAPDKNTEENVAILQDVISTFETFRDNLARNRKLTGDLIKEGKIDANDEDQLVLSTIYDAITGNKYSGPDNAEFKNLYDQSRNRLKNYIVNKRALEKFSTVKQAQKSDANLTAFTTNIANGTVDINSPQVAAFAAKVKKSKNLTKAQKGFKAVYDAVNFVSKKGLPIATKEGTRGVSENVFRTSSGWRKALADIVTHLNEGIASGDKFKVAEQLFRLKELTRTRQNKLAVLQDALITGDNNGRTYESVHARSLEPYTERVALRSFEMYDNIQQEQEIASEVYNEYLNILDDYGGDLKPDAATHKRLNVMPALANEAELKKIFKAKHPNTQDSTPRDDVEPTSTAQESTTQTQSTQVPPQQETQQKEFTQPSVESQQEADTTPPPLDQEQEEEDQEPEEEKDLPPWKLDSEPEEGEEEAATPIVQNSQDNAVDSKEDEDSEDDTIDNEDKNVEPEKGEEKTAVPVAQESQDNVVDTKDDADDEDEVATNTEKDEDEEDNTSSTASTTVTQSTTTPAQTVTVDTSYQKQKAALTKAVEDQLKTYNTVDVATDPNYFIVSNSYSRNNIRNTIIADKQANFNGTAKEAYKRWNNYVATIRATIFSKTKNENPNDNLSFAEKTQKFFEDISNKLDQAREAKAHAIKSNKNYKKVFENDTSLDKATLDRDIEKYKKYIAGWKSFEKDLLDPLNEEDGKPSLRLAKWFKNEIEKGTDPSFLILALKNNPDNSINWKKTESKRFIGVFMEFKDGKLVWNNEVENATGVATLLTQQNLENRASPKKDDVLQRELEQVNLDASILTQLNENEAKMFASGTSLDNVIEQLKANIMDVLGITGNPNISKSFDADAIVTTLAQQAVRYMMKRGDLDFDTFYFVNDNPNRADSPEWRRVTRYEAEKVPADQKVILTYAVPTIAYNDPKNPKDKKKSPYKSNTFESLYAEDIFRDTFLHEKKKDIYYHREDVPKAPEHKLRRPDVPTTELERKALENRMNVAYKPDLTFYDIINAIKEEGILTLQSLDKDPDQYEYNEETAASIDGRRTNLLRDYRVNVKRVKQAILENPDNPVLFEDITMQQAGRGQEGTPNGSQNSKLMRYLNPPVKTIMDPNDADTMIGFKRAVMQAFGKKVKRLTDNEVNELFDKLETDLQDKYGDTDLGSLFRTTNDIMDAYKAFESSLDGEMENPWVALSALINMARYRDAKRNNTIFTNSLTLEFDGSCNGFANSWMKLAYDDEFSEQNFKAMFRSQMFFGLGSMNSAEMWKLMPSDNYTGNAEATQKAISGVLANLSRNRDNPIVNPKMPWENPLTGQQEEISALTTAIDVMSFIGLIMGDAVKVNEKALKAGQLDGDYISIGRLVIKFPTVRINYGQGAPQNTREFIKDLSAELSKKFTAIVQNPNVPPYKIFFKDYITKGEMTDDQALDAFNHFTLLLYKLNNIDIDKSINKRSGDLVTTITFSKEAFVLPVAKPWNKGQLMTKQDKEEFKKFILKKRENYTENFASNIEQFFAAPMFNAIDKSRSQGFKEMGQLLTTYSAVAAETKAKWLIDKLTKHAEKNGGLLPSQKELNKLTREADKLFPTQVGTKAILLDMANTKKVPLKDFEIESRPISNLTVTDKDNPLYGKHVITEIRSPINARLPIQGGIGPIAKLTIATGDGNMQTVLFNFDDNDQSNVDRFDGVDTDPAKYKLNAEVINRAVYQTLDELPAYSVLKNIETFTNTIDELAKDAAEGQSIVGIDTLIALDRNLKEYDSEYMKTMGLKNKSDIPTIKALQGYVRSNFLKKAQTQFDNALINAVTLKSLPVSMHHMSSGQDGYVHIDPRDTFEIPEGLTGDEICRAVATEANRRREIIAKHLNEIKSRYETKKEFYIPDDVYKGIPTPKDIEEEAKGARTTVEEEPQVLVSPKPEPIKREIPNVRTQDRTVEATAPVAEAPKREVVNVQPQATNTSNTSTGRIDPILIKYFDAFCQRVEDSGNTQTLKVLKDFFVKFINDNCPPNMKVVISNNPKDFEGTLVYGGNPGVFYYDSQTLFVNTDIAKQIGVSVDTVVIHELVHGLVQQRLFTAYYDINHPAHSLVMNLQKTMNDMGRLMRKENPALYQKYKDYIFENTENRAYGLNEFINYMLTQQEFIDFAEGKGQAEIYNWKTLFNQFREILKRIFHISSNEQFKAFMTFYGQTALFTAQLIETVPDANSNGALDPSNIASYVGNTQSSIQANLASKVADVSNKVRARVEVAGYRQSSPRQTEMENKLLSVAQQAAIPLTKQDLALGSALAEIYNGAIDRNSSVRLDAINLRREILSVLKPEDLVFPNDGADTSLAQLRYDFIAGIDNNKDSQGNIDSLGSFMALMATSNLLREAVNKAYGKANKRKLSSQNAVQISDSFIDNKIALFGAIAIQEINNLLDSPNLDKDKKISELLDQLNKGITAVEKTTSILGKPTQLLNKGDELLSGFLDRIGTAFLTSDVFKGMINADNKFLAHLAQFLRVPTSVLLKDSNVLYRSNRKAIITFINSYGKSNPNFYSRVLTTALKELGKADENADQIYHLEKQSKAIVQASRNNWREVVPLEIKNLFKKEGVTLSKSQFASLDTTILTADLGALSEEQIKTLFTGSLNQEIAKRRRLVNSKAYEKAQQLAHYMVTREATHGMLRNAEAISAFTHSYNMQAIDELVTLLALKEREKDFEIARDIYNKAPNAVNFSISQQRQLRREEQAKADLLPQRRLNTYKGYYPQDTLTSVNVQAVPIEVASQWRALGYEEIGRTEDKNFIYMKSTLNPSTTFAQGGLQSVINQVGGIDETTGWSPDNRVYKRIKSPKVISRLSFGLSNRKPSKEAYIPLLDDTGTEIVGYEITINPDMYRSVVSEKDFAKNLGAWKGRQIEEQMAFELNKELIDTLKAQYENASAREKREQFVDVIELAKKDPVIAHSLNNISPKTLRYLSGKPKLPQHWYIRQDLIEDVVGRRQASVIDLQTGMTRWSPQAQRAASELVKKLLGQRAFAYLYRGETILKAATSSMRNFIVIRSGEVVALNIIGNMFSLMMRGIPITTILKEAPKVVKELENYNHSRQRQAILQMEYNAEIGKDNPSERRLRMLEARLQEEKSLVDKLSYAGELIKAGEYNTIADIGDVNDDILLATGRFGEYLEKQINKMPSVLKEAGRQIVLTKDTAIYRALEKGTQYGDFVAKAILYKHLKDKKQMKPKEALSKVRYEFVNYDMLPGRTREYLENIGLLWFYNYKLRITRTAVSMIKENPLHVILSMFAPIALGIGTPITDNFLAKLFTNPFGSVGPKLMDIPWIFNHLWYNMFS